MNGQGQKKSWTKIRLATGHVVTFYLKRFKALNGLLCADNAVKKLLTHSLTHSSKWAMAY